MGLCAVEGHVIENEEILQLSTNMRYELGEMVDRSKRLAVDLNEGDVLLGEATLSWAGGAEVGEEESSRDGVDVCRGMCQLPVTITAREQGTLSGGMSSPRKYQSKLYLPALSLPITSVMGVLFF